jgi:hypothetical protein
VSSAVETLTSGQQLVLHAIYDQFAKNGSWPTFIAVDRPLRRAHNLDTKSMFLSLPDHLVVKPAPNLHAHAELRLRLLGVLQCEGGAEDAERLVRLLPWLAQKEVEFEPEAGSTDSDPNVTSEEIRMFLGLDQDDSAALCRLHELLHLDNWGLSGGGGMEDAWSVTVGQDVWRFRDVLTVEDCVVARENWKSEAAAAITQTRRVPPYYHVRLSTVSNRHDEVRLDLSEDELEAKFLSPRRQGQPIVMNGAVISLDDITKIRINKTQQPSNVLRSIVRHEDSRSGIVFIGGPSIDWHVANKGEEVTERFITELPGHMSTSQPDAGLAEPLTPPATYVDERVIAAIRLKDEVCSFSITKLLDLIDELNDNCARANTYAAHTLLRAILDHIPPILGFNGFAEVANSYQWSQTDKKYIKRLLEFKSQGDDALHRQISAKPSLLDFADMPPSIYVSRLLQECSDKL